MIDATTMIDGIGTIAIVGMTTIDVRATGPGIVTHDRRRMCIGAGIAAAAIIGTITGGTGTEEPG